MKQFLLALVTLCLITAPTSPARAQTKEIDSLKNAIPKLTGNERLDATFELGQRLSSARQWDQAQTIFDSLLDLTVEQEEWDLMIKNSNELGKLYGMKGEIASSKHVLSQAIQLAESNNIETESIGITYFNLAASHYQGQKYDSSLILTKKAKSIFTNLNIQQRLNTLMGFEGIIYQKLGVYRMAADAYLQQVEAYKSQDSLSLGMAYQNLGHLYAITNENPKAEEYMLKAIDTYKAIKYKRRRLQAEFNYYIFANANKLVPLDEIASEQLKILEGVRSLKASPIYLTAHYHELGRVYQSLEEYDSAEVFYQKALTVNQQIERKESMCKNLLGLAGLYSQMGSTSQANSTLKQVKPLIDSLKLPEMLVSYYDIKAHLSARKNNYREFYKYFQLFNNIKDSLNTAHRLQELDQLPIIYETEKKEAELALTKEQAAAEKAKAQLGMATTGGAGLLALVIGGFLYRTNQLKKREQRLAQMNARIAQEKTNLAEEKEAIAEEKSALADELALLKDRLEHDVKRERDAIIENFEYDKDFFVTEEQYEQHKQNFENVLAILRYHQLLSRSGNDTRASLNVYFTELTEGYFKTFDKNLKPEQLKLITTDTLPDLSSRQRSFLISIFQELGKNAIRHAFPQVKEGEPWAKIGIQPLDYGNQLKLVYRDNGPGIPNNVPLRPEKGLGLIKRIVEQQFKGEVEKMGEENGGGCIKLKLHLI